MKALGLCVLSIAIVTWTSSHAQAQRQGGRLPGGQFTPLGLLAQESVQNELRLSDDQKKQVTEQAEKQRAALGDLRNLSRQERQAKQQEDTKANAAAAAAILNADQTKRFKQISLQQRGPRAFADPEIAQALNFTIEQNEKINAIRESIQAEIGPLFRAADAGGDRQETRKKMDAIRKGSDEKLQGLLTPEQQEKWKSLVGDPFKGEIRRPQFPAGNRGTGAIPNRGPNR
jgi:hypothetical protein